MCIQKLLQFTLVLVISAAVHTASGEPPFHGTIFVHPDIITEHDPTAFQGLADAGRGERRMFDRRPDDWVEVNAFLFTANYEEGRAIEIQVNPEFQTLEAARKAAIRFAPVIGRLPAAVRRDVRTVWIHQGTELFGGGNNNILIHTGQADLYVADGILEETLVHEGSHASLDGDHALAPGWVAAQKADPEFISTYARDHLTREDVAETFLLYLAVRYRSERIPESLARTISETVPHRIAYFDRQKLDINPMAELPTSPIKVIGNAKKE